MISSLHENNESVSERNIKEKQKAKKSYVISMIVFLFLFVVFVYGALFIGLLGMADWAIHTHKLDFFLAKGDSGILLFTLCILGIWFGSAYVTSMLFYAIFAFFGKKKVAKQASSVVFFAFFHIFTIPWILWPSLRDNVPHLRKNYRQKLKKMAKKSRQHKTLQEKTF